MSNGERMKLWFDADPGFDDWWTWLLLNASPVELLGVSVVGGNAPLEATWRNAQAIAQLHDWNTPLWCGQSSRSRPDQMNRTAQRVLGVDGMRNLGGPGLEFGQVLKPIQEFEWPQMGDSLPWLATGPLSNVARAIESGLRPSEIIWMGGSTNSGNQTAAAEFNAWADPEAAAAVFASGVPIRMVGLNICREVLLCREDIDQWAHQIETHLSGSAQSIARTFLGYCRGYQRIRSLDGAVPMSIYDPVAACALLHPEWFTFQAAHVEIELAGVHTVGMTVCDFRLRSPANCEVAVALDASKVRRWILDQTQHALGLIKPLKTSSDDPRIIVLGSVNQDLILQSEFIIQEGHTHLARTLDWQGGGKGANQAIAIANAGQRVGLVAAVGSDETGQRLIGDLEKAGVDCSFVQMIPAVSTGLAVVNVADNGQNAILVHPGANAELVLTQQVNKALMQAQWVIAQGETSLDITALAFATALDAMTVLNPSPAQDLSLDLLALTDVLVLNEHEATVLYGHFVSLENSARALAYIQPLIRQSKLGLVLLTLGENGVSWLGASSVVRHQEAIPVDPVDTTGAGDSFLGFWVASMACGKSIEDAVRIAQKAASLCIQRVGAQTSIPEIAEVKLFGNDGKS